MNNDFMSEDDGNDHEWAGGLLSIDAGVEVDDVWSDVLILFC